MYREHADILGTPLESVNSYLIAMLFLLEGNFAAKYSINVLYVNNITRGLTHNVMQNGEGLGFGECRSQNAERRITS